MRAREFAHLLYPLFLFIPWECLSRGRHPDEHTRNGGLEKGGGVAEQWNVGEGGEGRKDGWLVGR